jgi:AraC-like DNA-binding protein
MAQDLETLAYLRRARDLIDREYASPLDVAEIARASYMSQAHFSRQFKKAYGETPYAYLMTRRIERAKALLRRGDMSVTDVCMAVGCTSLGSFSARFTELVGQTPTSYRGGDHAALKTPTGVRHQGPDAPYAQLTRGVVGVRNPRPGAGGR